MSHASYLINLAAEGEFLEKSASAFADELRRCQTLNIPYLVIHPGSAGAQSIDDGIRKIGAALDRSFADSENSVTTVLLETTAGAGHVVGSRFEHLAAIIDKAKTGKRLGICLDTCHVFAAGYDIRTEETYARTMDALKKALPLSRLQFFHINDSVTGFNSHVDRHAHLGEGQLQPRSLQPHPERRPLCQGREMPRNGERREASERHQDFKRPGSRLCLAALRLAIRLFFPYSLPS